MGHSVGQQFMLPLCTGNPGSECSTQLQGAYVLITYSIDHPGTHIYPKGDHMPLYWLSELILFPTGPALHWITN